jgi:hypothetical protein
MMGVLGPSQVSVCAMQHPRRQTYSTAQLIDSVLDKSFGGLDTISSLKANIPFACGNIKKIQLGDQEEN